MDSTPTPQPRTVTLLTRAGCGSCVTAHRVLTRVLGDYGIEAEVIDVDDAAESDPDLRAEFGDRLPVVLLDGHEHSYWDVDVPRLRRDLGVPPGGGS